jgi:phosphotransferase system  glucose/maltose/N-acetylglucosamine-specific IIC component
MKLTDVIAGNNRSYLKKQEAVRFFIMLVVLFCVFTGLLCLPRWVQVGVAIVNAATTNIHSFGRGYYRFAIINIEDA